MEPERQSRRRRDAHRCSRLHDNRGPTTNLVNVKGNYTYAVDTMSPTGVVASLRHHRHRPTKQSFTVKIAFFDVGHGAHVSGDRGHQRQGLRTSRARGASYTVDFEPNANMEGDVTVRVPSNAAIDGANLVHPRGERDLRGGHDQGAGVAERGGGWRRELTLSLRRGAGWEFDTGAGRLHGECGERRAHGFQRGDWRLHRDADARSAGGTRRVPASR